MGEGSFTSSATTIQDANVNSNAAITLPGASITISTEVFSKVPTIAHSSLSGSHASRLSEGRYSGFANPKITITGSYYIGEDSSNTLTPTFMKELIASAEIKTLVSDVTGTVKVLIKNVTESNTYSQSTNGVVNYTLSLVQVKDV